MAPSGFCACCLFSMSEIPFLEFPVCSLHAKSSLSFKASVCVLLLPEAVLDNFSLTLCKASTIVSDKFVTLIFHLGMYVTPKKGLQIPVICLEPKRSKV